MCRLQWFGCIKRTDFLITSANQMCCTRPVFAKTKFSSLFIKGFREKTWRSNLDRWKEVFSGQNVFRLTPDWLQPSWSSSQSHFCFTHSASSVGSQSGVRRSWIDGGWLEGFGSENLQTCRSPATGEASHGVCLVNLNGSPRQEPPGRDNTEMTELCLKGLKAILKSSARHCQPIRRDEASHRLDDPLSHTCLWFGISTLLLHSS